MMRRIYFLLVSLFWVVMNVLLWRSEMAGMGRLGSAVPVNVIWEKILSAPDDSAMEILQDGKKIGYCRWRPNIKEGQAPGQSRGQTNAPEGQIKFLTGYTIDLEGNATLPDIGNVRFNFHGDFGADHAWNKLVLRGVLRPWIWELRTVAGEGDVAISIEADDQKWERRVTYAQLQNPATMLGEFGMPLPPLLFALPPLSSPAYRSPGSLGLNWTAHQDSLRIGQSQVRVYQLEAALLERYRAAVLVSRVGELLRVELPGGLVLVNDALSPF